MPPQKVDRVLRSAEEPGLVEGPVVMRIQPLGDFIEDERRPGAIGCGFPRDVARAGTKCASQRSRSANASVEIAFWPAGRQGPYTGGSKSLL